MSLYDSRLSNVTLIQLGSKYISYNTVFDLNASSVQSDPDCFGIQHVLRKRVSFKMWSLAQPYSCIRELTKINGHRYLSLFIQSSATKSTDFRLHMTLTSFFPYTFYMEYTFDEIGYVSSLCLAPIRIWSGDPEFIHRIHRRQKKIYKNLKDITI